MVFWWYSSVCYDCSRLLILSESLLSLRTSGRQSPYNSGERVQTTERGPPNRKPSSTLGHINPQRIKSKSFLPYDRIHSSWMIHTLVFSEVNQQKRVYKKTLTLNFRSWTDHRLELTKGGYHFLLTRTTLRVKSLHCIVKQRRDINREVGDSEDRKWIVISTGDLRFH